MWAKSMFGEFPDLVLRKGVCSPARPLDDAQDRLAWSLARRNDRGEETRRRRPLADEFLAAAAKFSARRRG